MAGRTAGRLVGLMWRVRVTVSQVAMAAVPGVDGAAGKVDPLPQVGMHELSETAGNAQRLANPAALGGEFFDGLRDLLRRSDYINKVVADDFMKAQARLKAREAHQAVTMPGSSGMLGQFGPPNVGMSFTGAGSMDMMGLAAAAQPGPAARHPGMGTSAGQNLNERWEILQDTYDRAFIRYTEFAAYQLQSAELNKITDQLSNAINSLVRAS